MNSNNKSLAFIILNLAIAISLGALGAHGLKKVLTPESLESFKTGVLYHLLLSITLIGLHSIALFQNLKGIKIIRSLITIGMLCFCLSIYLLSTSNVSGIALGKIIGPITPFGGFLMILGLVLLSWKVYKTEH